MRAGRRAATLGFITVGLAILGAGLAPPASAHPLGNFSINQYSGVRVEADRVHLRYVVDMAEIPTFQARASVDTNGDKEIDPNDRSAYSRRECRTLASGLAVVVDGRGRPLKVVEDSVSFPMGAAGLPTMRLECRYEADAGVAAGERAIRFTNANFADRIGWREITAVGDGAVVTHSNVPAVSVSAELTNYPQDLLASPLDQREARLVVRAGGARPADSGGTVVRSILPRGVDRATAAFMGLVSRPDFTAWFAAVAIAVAILLGAMHALAPGHGKTIVAAYLVGQRGSFRQSVMIGATVAATHTVGVLGLGLLLSLSQAIASERLYPILGLAAGTLLAWIGLGLLRRAMRNRKATHGDLAHEHDAGTHVHEPPPGELRWRNLVAMGFAGGLVPSPSALVVLLGAIALGRAWFGIILVLAYGLGMATVLIGAGLLLVRARSMLDRLATRRGRAPAALARLIPVVTAALIVVVGASLALRGALAI